MKKRLKIGFDESSKAVTAHVTQEWLLEENEIDTFINEEALNEVQALFSEAKRWASLQSMEKMRRQF